MYCKTNHPLTVSGTSGNEPLSSVILVAKGSWFTASLDRMTCSLSVTHFQIISNNFVSLRQFRNKTKPIHKTIDLLSYNLEHRLHLRLRGLRVCVGSQSARVLTGVVQPDRRRGRRHGGRHTRRTPWTPRPGGAWVVMQVEEVVRPVRRWRHLEYQRQ